MRHLKSKTFHLSWALVMLFATTVVFFIASKYQTPFDSVPGVHDADFSPTYSAFGANPEKNLKSEIHALSLPNGLNPKSIFLPVPFTPQAPTANWDELHNEACEEASAIMAASYYSPPKIGEDAEVVLDPVIVEQEISKLTHWQQETFGYYLSIDSQEIVKMIKDVYELNAEIVENFTANDIKKALSKNRLVLLPANGRLLGNPYYKRPGPIYHMLVIKGYDSKGNFITNDPGTRHGLNYPYAFDVLYNANGNYDHTTREVDLNKKMVILIFE